MSAIAGIFGSVVGVIATVIGAAVGITALIVLWKSGALPGIIGWGTGLIELATSAVAGFFGFLGDLLTFATS